MCRYEKHSRRETYVSRRMYSDILWNMARYRRQEVPLEQMFSALADPTRLRLVNLMAGGEICVCYFVQVLGAPQPKISRHLAYLRKAGVVAARREGKWMHYRLAIPKDEVAASILQETLKHLREKAEMRRDVSRLGVACCSPQKFELPQRAPQPALLVEITHA